MTLNIVKDKQIVKLEANVTALEIKVSQLEDTNDKVDKYEQSDTLIISGSSLPVELTQENPSDIIVNTIKHNLHVNNLYSNINVAHHLAPKYKVIRDQ